MGEEPPVLGLEESEWSHQCPSTKRLFPASVRKPLHNMVDGVCPRSSPIPTSPTQRKLVASQFQVSQNNYYVNLRRAPFKRYVILRLNLLTVY